MADGVFRLLWLFLLLNRLKAQLWWTKVEMEENQRMMLALDRRMKKLEVVEDDKAEALAQLEFLREAWNTGWFVRLYMLGRVLLLLAIPVALYLLWKHFS